MTWTRVDYDIALEVASHEAIIRQAYKDSKNVWTWSVGLTNATGHNVERYIGKPQSLEHCLRIYAWALDRYAEAVRKAFAGHTLTKAQFAAALSFHWNTGAIGKASWVKHFRAGKMPEAERGFMLYNKPPEIVSRRKKEADLLFRGKWSNNGTMTEYTALTSKSTPVWSSARRINVEKELKAALARSDDVIQAPDIPTPKPAQPPVQPVPRPPVSDGPGLPPSLPAGGSGGAVAAIVALLAAAGTALWGWLQGWF